MSVRASALITTVLLMGCPDDGTDTWPDPDPSTETDTDTDTDTDEDTDPGVDTDAFRTEHCGLIDGSEVWTAADNPHVVTCTVELEGAEVVIEEGVEVYFLPTTQFRVSLDGFQSDLRVLGTEANPVYFGPSSGPGPGKWAGVYIGEFAGDIRLEHLTINGGGWGGGSNLYSHDVPLALRDVTLEQSGNIGLTLRDNASITASSEGLVVTESASYAVLVDAPKAHTLPATRSAYTGNGLDVVLLDNSIIQEAVEWEDLGIPYAIESLLRLEGNVPAPAILTIGPGVEVQAEVGAVLRVAVDGGAAGLMVEGTEADPVRFTSLRAGVDAHWQGIVIGEAAVDNRVEFHNTTIEWAGSNSTSQANLIVNDSPVLVDNLTVQNGRNYGVRLSGYDGYFRTGSNGLVISDMERPLEIAASEVGSIPLDTEFLNNRINMVEVDGNRVFFDDLWPVLDVPYRLTGSTTIAAPVGTSATVTLPPGSDVRMGYRAAINLGGVVGQGSGNLYAVGTPAEPVVITAADAYSEGAWRTITMAYCTDETQFVNFELAYAITAFTFTPLSTSNNQTCNTPLIDQGTVRDVSEWAYSQMPDGFAPGDAIVYDNLGFGVSP